MYKSEITTLINENYKLICEVTRLLKSFNLTSDISKLELAEEIQGEIAVNQRKIEKLRGKTYEI